MFLLHDMFRLIHFLFTIIKKSIIMVIAFIKLDLCHNPTRTQTFVTCLFHVHKCSQTLKQSIKVFNQHLFDVCKSLKNVLFWLRCYYNINELQRLLRNYCTNVRKSSETPRQMLSDIYLRHYCLIFCLKFLVF